MSVTEDFLRRWYEGAPGHFTLIAFGDGKVKATRWYGTAPKEIGRAARTAEHYADKYDLYISVATHKDTPEDPRSKSRGSLKTVQSIPGFWADLDYGTAGHKPAALPLPKTEKEALSILEGLPEPTALVHSGGGIHAYWRFNEPWTFDDASAAQAASEAWQRRLVQQGEALGYHVDSLGDLPRILRVPGSLNHKTGTPRPVKVRHMGARAYPSDLLASLGVEAEARTPADQQIEDNFPLSWEEILKPHGYTFAGTDNASGGQFIIRPGKSKSEGHSGVIDPYGVPVLVNYSASDQLPTGAGQRLTKLRVYAHLNYDGDIKAAKKAISKLTKDTPEKLAEIAERFRSSLIDWSTIWTDEDPDPDWLVEPFLERGRLVAFFSEAKAGKTLLWWEICAALSKGEPVLGNPARDPVRVLYIDKENIRKDVREKLGKMGYEGEQLENFFYYSFPDLSFLDTEEGGRELYALAKYHHVDMVIIDTLSRVVEGGENDSDSYHNFYNYTGVRLKAEGIALVRLDHAGKDLSKGMRGSSSKTTDVDEIWALSLDADMVTVTRTLSRTNHGESNVVLIRSDDPTLAHRPLATTESDEDYSSEEDLITS